MSASSIAEPAGRRPVHTPWLILPVLCVAVLVVNIDSTILNVALPTLIRKLHATSEDLQWIVDAYSLGFGGLLLVSGSFADHIGRKRAFLTGFAVFAIGSLGASLSGSVGTLIAFRALMGTGAALQIPAGLSILGDVFRTPEMRARAVGMWGGTIGVGLAVGPVAGGLLLAHFAWGSIFLVNVPIVALGGLAAWRLVPESRDPAADAPDRPGALLSILGLGTVLWGVIEAPLHGWTSALVLAAVAAGVAILVGLIFFERHSSHPMLRLEFFRSPRFSAALLAVGLGLFAVFGAVFVLSQLLQNELGYTPLQAGVRILPIAGVLALTAPLSTLVVRAIGSKLVAAAGLASMSAGYFLISGACAPAVTYLDVLPGMLCVGLGAGLLMPTAADAVLGAVPRAKAGVGSATYGVSIQVGGALGVAVLGSISATRYQHHVTALVARLAPPALLHTITGSLGAALVVAARIGPPAGPLLADAARTAFLSGAHLATAVAAFVALAGALIVVVALPSRAPLDR
ncbi:MAG: MFS transporter [Solirubrobacteraceae bacterium]|jgi:EmrB/QacA subfamily drug resistance transporter